MADVSSNTKKESAPAAPLLSMKEAAASTASSNKETTPTEKPTVKGSPSSAVTSFTPGQSDSTVSPANDKDASNEKSPNENDVNVSRDSGMVGTSSTDVSQEISTGSNRTGSDANNSTGVLSDSNNQTGSV